MKLTTYEGLTEEQVLQSKNAHGSNVLSDQEGKIWLDTLKDIVSEPMFLLLVAACCIYLILGEWKEGVIMGVSLLLVAGISFYQEHRSRGAVEALKKLSASRAAVWRSGMLISIAVEELVVDDYVKIEEGEIIPADGVVIFCNDLSVNESILTGESMPVVKDATDTSSLYKGTLVISGYGHMKVTAVGNKTQLGKIGVSLQEIEVEKTPLQQQIRSFVKYMAWIGGVAFAIIVVYGFFQTHNWLQALLSGLTLAMSILPEEIPVAFSTFQALGAFRLLKNNAVIVKKSQHVETLGAATVICADKTGTITQNKMSVEFLIDAKSAETFDVRKAIPLPEELLSYAMWSSEVDPFDPMEKSIHELYASNVKSDQRGHYSQIHEYPLEGKPPMMTHIFRSVSGELLVAAKGAPEAIMACSQLTNDEKMKWNDTCIKYAAMGYRVLGVGKGDWKIDQFPEKQQSIPFDFLGLIVFQDPPKKNIDTAISSFHKAGIAVKMITGDYPETAAAIAKQVRLSDSPSVITGDQIMHLSMDELRKKVATTDVFARMYPDAKLRIIEALKENGEIVAMTGDGVNDAPALKAAHIGIAMGTKGSEVAKNTASLIISDDDLAHMVDAVAMGRKIYGNLKKAIQYIVSIHIPIILIVAVPLLFQWKFNALFSPVHVIFLELIMGPTCSIIYENEPIEPGWMLQPAIKRTVNFLSFKQLSISVIQGLAISIACLGIGLFYSNLGYNEGYVRTVVFSTLLLSNVMLTLINRSSLLSLLTTLKFRNNLIPWVVAVSLIMVLLGINVPFFQHLFGLEHIGWLDLSLCFLAAFAGTCWMEAYKYYIRKKAGI